jgi:cold shock CspA family protein
VSVEVTREHGTIVAWKSGRGSIRADNGDILILFYWSVLKGFRDLAPGRRVEFSRGAGLRRNLADVVLVSEPMIQSR